MTAQGEPHQIYLAAAAGRVEPLKALLQDLLPVTKHLHNVHQSQQGLQEGTYLTATDYLEYVDKQTGFTPLLAAVFNHREQCAKLLLEHGADVHNHGAKTYQTPMRMAVTDLNMDTDMVDLLVSYGASPFLEAKDGVSAMDEVVRLRHHRIGPMPHDLGSVLLCLRRRCAFRGHLELKVDRYLGLSQTWRKFFCLLSPREKVVGYPVDMQLLIFSKNGFDPVTSIWMTNAAPIEIPLRAAHGRACYELALSNRQQKKPGKLFAQGSSRTGFSIFVRALSKDAVEAKWLRRFVHLATSEPSIAMLNGDSEPPMPLRHSPDTAGASVAADKSSVQLQPVVQAGGTISFSDSAHVSLSQSQNVTDAPAQSQSKAVSPARIPTIPPTTLPNGPPAQAPATPCSNSYAAQEPAAHQSTYESASPAAYQPASQAAYQPASQAAEQAVNYSSSFSSSLTAAQQPSSAAPSEVGSSASSAPGNQGEVWRSNPAYGVATSTSSTIMPLSSYRASQSLPSFKAFTSVDKRLTDSWRAKLLKDLEDESDNEQGTDLRMTLPVVSEHDSLPFLMQQWGLQSTDLTQDLHSSSHQAPVPCQQTYESSASQTAALGDSYLSSTVLLSPKTQAKGASLQGPAGIISSPRPVSPATPPAHTPPQSDLYRSRDSPFQQLRQAQRHDQLGEARGVQAQQAPSQAELAAEHRYVGSAGEEQQAGNSMLPLQSLSLLSDSNLEVVKARSNMLDIPSAELLDSILDFANAVCGEQQNDTAYSPLKGAQEDASAWGDRQTRTRSEPTHRRPPAFSCASLTESIEPFSDDDDITILDTTEVKKLSPEGLQPLPEAALPSPGPPRRQVLNPNQLDSHDEDDLVYEMQRVTLHDAPFHHYSQLQSPHVAEQNSPNAAARYGHMNRMYDTSTSDVSSHGAGLNVTQCKRGTSPEYSSQHQNSIYDSSGSHSMVDQDYQLYQDVIEQAELLPQMEPSEFREMIDGIMAHSEQQAAQVHMTGGATSTTSALHPIWEDEESCLEGQESPCIATIGVPAS